MVFYSLFLINYITEKVNFFRACFKDTASCSLSFSFSNEMEGPSRLFQGVVFHQVEDIPVNHGQPDMGRAGAVFSGDFKKQSRDRRSRSEIVIGSGLVLDDGLWLSFTG